MSVVHYRTQHLGDVELFYRETGPADAPVLLLLHGFPTASHIFRDLLPLLCDRFRLIAPALVRPRPPRAAHLTTSSIMARQSDCGLRQSIPSGSRQSSHKMAMPMKRASATSGVHGRHIGAIPAKPTAMHVAVRSRRKRSATGNTAPARTLYCSALTGMSWTSPIWRDRVPRRYSWICFSTTKAMLRSIPRSRHISEHIARRCWRYGGGTIRRSCRQGRWRSSATFRTQRFTCWTQGTSRWKRTMARSQP
jgi:hypothetical protein